MVNVAPLVIYVAENKREEYYKFISKEKGKIAQYTSENGVAMSLHYFKRTDEYKDWKKSTEREWKAIYCKALNLRKRGGGEIYELPEKI